MPGLYCYTARSAQGAFLHGSIEAATASAALTSLRARGLFVTSLENEAGAKGMLTAAALRFGPVPRKEFVALFRSFATLIHAGVPMRRSLEVTIEQCTNGRLREAVAGTLCDIENGLSLSQAMARHPKEFPRLYVTMIKAGELGGVLDEVLDRLAGVLERDQSVRKRVISALAYPAVVASAALALIIFLLTSVIPAFAGMYAQMHVPMPRITSALFAAGSLLREPKVWIASIPALTFILLGAVRIKGSEAGTLALEAVAMRAPVFGAIVRKSMLARLSRMLGTLLRSGVGLVAALDVTGDLVTSAPYRRSVLSLRRALEDGSSFSGPLSESGLYEPMFVQMVRVGEETGALDTMLLRLADYYDLDVDTSLSALGSMLEPLMILLLGGAVGFIAAAVFIPLYTLIGSIK